MIATDDTIAAIATASGPAAVGIVRISGPGAAGILERVVGIDLQDRPRRLTLSMAKSRSGEAIDQVLAVLMPGPASFTGEDVAELQGHGGAQTAKRLLAAAIDAGARAAEPGEFSRRAFENGRIDLTQAEGILAVISAGGERAMRVGTALLAGELRSRIDALSGRINAVLAAFEAAIDFPEDVELGSHLEELQALHEDVATLAATSRMGRALRDGITVAIVGAVNAGKSSLFNRLVGRQRALVAAEPGTTRDFVEVELEWNGVAVTLIDTAGERSAEGLEERGIELGRARARECDFELVVVPVGTTAPAIDESRQILVWSKCDLAGEHDGGIATSAVSGAGLEALRDTVLSRAEVGDEFAEPVVLVSERQRQLVGDALASLARARSAASAGRPAELVAADLQLARGALARLVGKEVSDEMLDSLFVQFCIGK